MTDIEIISREMVIFIQTPDDERRILTRIQLSRARTCPPSFGALALMFVTGRTMRDVRLMIPVNADAPAGMIYP